MHKPQILYVDDEPFNLMLFEANFEDQFHVLTAENGIEGLEILKQNANIAVVFSDLKMPKMNGIEFVNKAYLAKSSIPYYLVTGFHINQEIKDLINKKILKKYFMKPFDINEISLEIEQELYGKEGL